MMTAGVRKMLCLNDLHDWDFDTGFCRACGEKVPGFDREYAERIVVRRPAPPYVTVAECCHCLEDTGEPR